MAALHIKPIYPSPSTPPTSLPKKEEKGQKKLDSDWTWTQAAKYGLYTAGALIAGVTAYSQLRKTVQHTAQAASTAILAATKMAPTLISTLNTGAEFAQTGAETLGSGIGLLRHTGHTLFDTPPGPKTAQEKAALGYEFFATAWVVSAISYVGLAITPPIIKKPVESILPKTGPTFVATLLSGLTIHTAFPNLLSKLSASTQEFLSTLPGKMIGAASTVTALGASYIYTRRVSAASAKEATHEANKKRALNLLAERLVAAAAAGPAAP